MTNKARGEFAYTLGKEKLDFAMTLQAGEMLENTGNPSINEMFECIAMMTEGTSKPRTVDQIKKNTITIADFQIILAGVKKAANDALPDDLRAEGNEQNRQQRRATKSSKKKK